MAQITLSNVGKKYENGRTILEGMNLSIHDKEFLVLVGPSGCGKTTTLRLIAGLESITSGDLYMDEEKVNNLPPGKRDIAMVFQDYALYPNMTVYENMAFGLKTRKIPAKEISEKINRVSKRLEITQFLKTKPRALSGGQRQRVALGRAMVRESSVFLFDEPLSNLDAQLRANMRMEISMLHKELQTTFVYVTHDQTEAMTMADRIAVMKNGEILQLDTPGEIYHHPANIFVAGFIGSPKMNFLEGAWNTNGTNPLLEIHGFSVSLPPSFRAYMSESFVTVGIRPEDLSIVPQKNATLTGKIQFVEKLGAENDIHILYDGGKLVVRTTSSDFSIGEAVGLTFAPEKLHFFSKESGMRLEPAALTHSSISYT